jgi:protoporphyrinogen/coproporphyrinogen III oxidase
MRTAPSNPRALVLGAGITGLSAAYELEKLGFETELVEASARCGGKVLSQDVEGLAVEAGPDSFLAIKPQAIEYVEELGLGSELLPSHPSDSTVFVYTGGRLKPLPKGMGLGAPSSVMGLWGSDILSIQGRLRASMEPFIPLKDGEEDESLASFIRRRLGREVLEKIAGPVLGGIYAGDPETLSLQSTFPQLAAMERGGGLWRSGRAKKPQALPKGRTMFMTLRCGMGRIVETLEKRLKTPPRKGVEALAIDRRGGQWEVKLKDGRLAQAPVLISALPAWRLAELVGDYDLEMGAILREIPFASTATATFIFDKKSLPRSPKGFGFIIPAAEGKTVTAATYTSAKFPGKVPEGLEVIRCFAPASNKSDEELGKAVLADLNAVMGWGDAVPRATRVFQWRKANPQYTMGHPSRLRRMESCLKGHPGLYVAGCSYYGVGLSDCISSARKAAAAAGQYLLGKGKVSHAR